MKKLELLNVKLLNNAKNQLVIEYIKEEEKIIRYFKSYNSNIAVINNGYIMLGNDWDYSQTTLKYLYIFLNQYIDTIEKNQHDEIIKALNSRNKKQAIQKMIDNNIIIISEYL